eukprot:TRINITY_DN18999_c0_g1_i1.p1 TRINITY_DN18999_c0_g1~~TRINITY_DN18999_c0_g1_i1.p1  ORF type:complete len:161 (-),score=34.64 TRINITY_DN18999_c0_g1_i1:168-650(-)
MCIRDRMNYIACDSISEAFQKRYSFLQHKKRMAAIAEKSRKSILIEAQKSDYAQIEMRKIKIRRKYQNEQNKLEEIKKSNEAMIERIVKQSNRKQDKKTFESKYISSSRNIQAYKEKERIDLENNKLLVKFICPKRSWSIISDIQSLDKISKPGQNFDTK